MAPPKLRAVSADDIPPAPAIESVTDAAEHGSHLDLLKQLRLAVARKLDDPKTSGVALAALANRALEIGREIEALEKSEAEEARERSEATPDEAWDATAI